MNHGITNISHHLPSKTTKAATVTTIPIDYKPDKEEDEPTVHAAHRHAAWEWPPEAVADRVGSLTNDDIGTVRFGEEDQRAQILLVEDSAIVTAEAGPDMRGELTQQLNQSENRQPRQKWILVAVVLILVIVITIVVVVFVIGSDRISGERNEEADKQIVTEVWGNCLTLGCGCCRTVGGWFC